MPFLKQRLAPILASLLIACLPLRASAQEESAVRAAMIFNLLKFITWPVSLQAEAPLRICLVKASRELNEAMKILNGRSVGKHMLNIQTDRTADDVSHCEVVATDATAVNAYDPAQIARHGLLTIGNSDFIDRGGMIGIVMINNRLRFEINVTKMQQAGIDMSAKVLQLALRTR